MLLQSSKINTLCSISCIFIKTCLNRILNTNNFR